jgi:hypothetical protein
MVSEEQTLQLGADRASAQMLVDLCVAFAAKLDADFLDGG